MELTQKQTVQTLSLLLFLAVATQVIYTPLYVAANDVPRQWLWGLEGLIFVLMATFAGAALVQAKQHVLGFSAITACAILNVVQVGIGLTQFGPFGEVAQSVEGTAPAAGAVVALSFFIYNAAKVLLGLAAVVFGLATVAQGGKMLGRITVLVGAIAIVANAIVMMFGRIDVVPSGATGVIATAFLAICLRSTSAED